MTDTEKKEKSMGCLKIGSYAFCGIMCLFVFIVVLTEGGPKSKESDKLPISDIEWREIGSIYGQDSNATDLQKEQSWKKYKGKKVKWRGKVYEVEKYWGTLQMQIIMGGGGNTVYFGEHSFSSSNINFVRPEVIVVLKDSETEKAAELKSSDYVTFEGILSDWDSQPSVTVDEGAIIKE